MAVSFPSISPSGRQYTAANWPTNSLDSQSGTTTRRLWGNLPARASLTLVFNNVGDATTESIMSAHYAAKGACEEITFANETMGVDSGICNTNLADSIRLDSGDHRWHFVERNGVSVQSVGLGLSTVTCKFRSEIPGS